ncbi:hypothetical protein ACGFIF_32160 [Kribbella sp. NPDC049174]|uniref:hypothetical protein n=1 Tax=Kribbella sp. NPDC049174 TaxID=3364112 RepID=UPI00370FEC69
MDDEPVRSYFSGPPRWLLPALAGLIGGAGTGIFVRTDGQSWTESGVFAAISAVLFALGAWWFEPRWKREWAEVEGDLPEDTLQLARRAAERGPVPTDPEIRAAALRIASHSLTGSSWRPGPKAITAIGVVLAIATVGAAVSGSLWAVLYANSTAMMLYSGWLYPRQLRRRIELLTAADTPAA